MDLNDLSDYSFSLSQSDVDLTRRLSDIPSLPEVSEDSREESRKSKVTKPEQPPPSFRKMLFPIKPAIAANAIYSPKLDIAAAKRKTATASASHQNSLKPRIKTKYEKFKEKKYMQNHKASLAETKREKNKGSIRFSIGDSALESDMTIAALNSDDFTIFEENPESDDQSVDGRSKNSDVFDLQGFLNGLKKPKAAVKNLKASRVDELKARIEEHGSVQDGLSKEECQYYIEAFISIDTDESGEITESELFEAMDKLNMDCSIEKVREMIKSVDVNGDGDVSVDEFLKLMAGLRAKITFLQSNDQLEFAFNLIDRDQDKFIGLQDLMTLFDDISDKEVDFNSCKKMLHAALGESYLTRKSEEPKLNFAQFVKLVKAIGQ